MVHPDGGSKRYRLFNQHKVFASQIQEAIGRGVEVGELLTKQIMPLFRIWIEHIVIPTLQELTFPEHELPLIKTAIKGLSTDGSKRPSLLEFIAPLLISLRHHIAELALGLKIDSGLTTFLKADLENLQQNIKHLCEALKSSESPSTTLSTELLQNCEWLDVLSSLTTNIERFKEAHKLPSKLHHLCEIAHRVATQGQDSLLKATTELQARTVSFTVTRMYL